VSKGRFVKQETRQKPINRLNAPLTSIQQPL